MEIIYIANIIVAGWISITSIFNPKLAAATIFQNAYPDTEITRLTGCLWLSIAIISFLGLWQPLIFAPILLVQLIYKSAWLLFVALPAFKNKQPYPAAMALFFLVWVMALPFFIPWDEWIK
ncbi:hypothetical protein [Ferruginibacter sp. SUN106]|uniref:hypothetical protein n=1 Tax=Ferruginibacter sp. SUN106 TaxID=2978348 RepID=UPI003D36425D